MHSDLCFSFVFYVTYGSRYGWRWCRTGREVRTATSRSFAECQPNPVYSSVISSVTPDKLPKGRKRESCRKEFGRYCLVLPTSTLLKLHLSREHPDNAGEAAGYSKIASFFLPDFTILIWLAYIRKKYNYTDYPFISFHNQSFLFILLVIRFLVNSIINI